MLNKLKTLVGLWQDLGPLNTALFLVHRLLSGPSGGRAGIERFIFVAQPVPAQAHLAPGKSASTVIKRLNPSDPLLMQCQRPAEVIAARFAQGALCLAIIKGDEVQGSIWLIERHYDEDVVRARFVLPPTGSAVWDFDVYVAPKYRLGFTFLKLWDAANAHIRERGARWTYSRITAFNLGSLASHTRLGARPFGSATFLILGKTQIMVSTLAPKLHISFGQSRPELQLPDIA